MYVFPQMIGISIITFILIRLLPGNPASIMAGGFATEETIKAIEVKLGLDQPLYMQYFIYVKNVFNGDLGTSWYTGNPVAQDLLQRVPATLELLLLALFFAFLIGVPLGLYAAFKKGGVADRIVKNYGLLAGSLPDFWFGLILIFIFYHLLGWLPAPMGRLDLAIMVPPRVTGFLLIDSLLNGNIPALKSTVQHLILPVATLTFVNMAAIVKMTRSTVEELMDSGFLYFGQACGWKIDRSRKVALKNALPPIITITAVLFSFLFSGAVLVETVFGWGGVGQYAVQSVINSDFAPIQAFVLVAAVLNLLVYLVVDLIHFAIDPRIRT